MLSIKQAEEHTGGRVVLHPSKGVLLYKHGHWFTAGLTVEALDEAVERADGLYAARILDRLGVNFVPIRAL